MRTNEAIPLSRRCVLCGSNEGLLLNHYEEHLNNPQVVDICISCHSKLPGHHQRRKIVLGEPMEIRVLLPPSVVEWIDGIKEERELGGTRSAIIRSLLVNQKQGGVR